MSSGGTPGESPSEGAASTGAPPSDEADTAPPPPQTPQSPEAQEAEDWLDTFRRQSDQHSVLALPYGEVDTAALLSSGRTDLFDQARDLSALTLRTPSGENIPLLSVVRVDVQSAATQVYRQNRQTMLNIQANLAEGVTLPDARKAMEEVLAAATLPPGYRYAFDGAFRQNDEAGLQMLINMVLALVMIYVVMAAVFESLLFPAAIMSSIVFSIFGVFWLFWATGTVFTIMAFIGILVLMGVVVNNGIVMVEHINILRRAGLDRTSALVQGSRDRLRPILMTMGTAILGMVPIALSSTQMAGDGPPYYPMARAIAGGLAFSTLVSLLFLPTIYAILDDMSAFVSSKFGRARELAPMAPSGETVTQAE